MKDDKLAQQLERLNDILERKSQVWRVFLSGVITGVGTAVGAALIGSLIVGLIASNLDRIPFIRDIVPQDSLGGYIENDN